MTSVLAVGSQMYPPKGDILHGMEHSWDKEIHKSVTDCIQGPKWPRPRGIQLI